jgi:membrane protein DedA with SNARE-associated domain
MPHDWLLAISAGPLLYLVVYALAALDGVFPLVPSESVVIAVAALWMSSGTPNLALLLLAASAGAFTGDQLAYVIGRRIDVHGIRILNNPRGRRMVDWAERALVRRGPSFILAARFVPVGRVAVNLTAGAIGYPRRRYAGLTALASLSWSVYSVAIGLLAGAWFHGHPFVAAAVGIVGGLLGGIALDRVLSRRRIKTATVGAPFAAAVLG